MSETLFSAAAREPSAAALSTADPSLDPSQLEAVMHPGPTVRILAGPGSGKTRVLTSRIVRRIEDGSADPRHILTLTFTRRAAGELRDRLRASGIRDIANVGTFHAMALQQLRQYRMDKGKRGPEVVANRAATLRSLATAGRNVTGVIGEIERAAARGLTAEALANRPGRSAAAELFGRYEAHKKTHGLLDFDDILVECARLLRRDDTFAAAQRWRFRHLFVDEFQDVNQTQFELLRAWLGEREDLCVVGDPDQAIYGWNGADAKYLTGFTHWFPAAVTLELLTNHRSAAPVVAAAAAVLGDRYITVRKPIGPDPTVAAHQTPGDEAADIADRIRWKHGEGGKWSSHAVLARTNAQLDVIADALSDANIPFRIRGRGHVSARPGAKAALEALTKSSDRFAAVLVDLELDESVDNDTVLILELGRDYTSSTPSPSGPGFAQWMRTIRSTDLSSDTDAVDLVTFHASKGLEWTHISIIGFEDGLVPMNDSDEDRRLAYVALTRAELSIHLSWCRTRPRDGLLEARSPSPWLEAIEVTIAPEVPADSVQVETHLSKARSALGARVDSEKRDTLIAWRRQAALVRQVAPGAVLRDDHLELLVRGNPRTVEDLVQLTGLSLLRIGRDADAILEALAEPPRH